MEKLKALTFFNDELDLLGEMPGYRRRAKNKQQLRHLIKWNEVGEIIKINNAPIRVNEIRM